PRLHFAGATLNRSCRIGNVVQRCALPISGNWGIGNSGSYNTGIGNTGDVNTGRESSRDPDSAGD
ncbi:hypothetical protein PJK52_29315, partial [Mycobacterium kansasii]